MTPLENHVKAERENIARLEKELAHAKADLILAIEKFYGLVPGVTRIRNTGDKKGTEYIYHSVVQTLVNRPWVSGVRPGGKQVRNLYGSWEVVSNA